MDLWKDLLPFLIVVAIFVVRTVGKWAGGKEESTDPPPAPVGVPKELKDIFPDWFEETEPPEERSAMAEEAPKMEESAVTEVPLTPSVSAEEKIAEPPPSLTPDDDVYALDTSNNHAEYGEALKELIRKQPKAAFLLGEILGCPRGLSQEKLLKR